jgi:hypothetical protein
VIEHAAPDHPAADHRHARMRFHPLTPQALVT